MTYRLYGEIIMNTFEQCCEYLGISTDLPKCHIDEKKFQAVYKLRVCVNAWNKIDGFEPNETANYYQEGVGYTPYLHLRDGRLLSSGHAYYGSYAGIVYANAHLAAAHTSAYFGLRLCLKSIDRAVDFGKTFIDIFNELI